MDPGAALELVKHGATLLFLDVPRHTLVGVDTQVFSAGPAFKGIKMIPPGVHFVFYSSSSRYGKEFSPAIGFFIDAGQSQVITRKWDEQEEQLIKLSEEEEERYGQAVRNLEFDRHLGPYDLSHYGNWKRLSNFITKDIIEKLEPLGGEINVACEVGMMKKSAMERALDEQLKNNAWSTATEKPHKKGCYYTSIPRVIKRQGIESNQLTSLNLDKSELLETLLEKEYGSTEDSLLGELQFSFVAFMMGQSLEAFMQWKSIVSLLLGCIEAPFKTRIQMFVKFMKVVYYQLKYGLQKDDTITEQGTSVVLDDSWFSSDSFLRHLCEEFFAMFQDVSAVDGSLLTWTRKLKGLLESALGWEFQRESAVDGTYYEENDEYAPVVVESLDD